MSEEKSTEQPVELNVQQVQPEKKVSAVECSMCGRDGGPAPDCELCLGNKRFIQSRSFTRTEEQQGLNKEEAARRYGRTGDVNPRIVQLPGGVLPGGGN